MTDAPAAGSHRRRLVVRSDLVWRATVAGIVVTTPTRRTVQLHGRTATAFELIGEGGATGVAEDELATALAQEAPPASLRVAQEAPPASSGVAQEAPPASSRVAQEEWVEECVDLLAEAALIRVEPGR